MKTDDFKKPKNKKLDNKYKNIQQEDHNVKDIKNYKGPIPAYKTPKPKEISTQKSPTSVIEDNLFEKFDSQNEHTAILDDKRIDKNRDPADIFKNIQDNFNLDDNKVKLNIDSPSQTKSFDSVKNSKNREESSVSDQYEKFINDDYGKDRSNAIYEDENNHMSEFEDPNYEEFYDEYDEKPGFFERIRIRRDEKRFEKENFQAEAYDENQEEYYEEYIEPQELDTDYKNSTETRDKIYWLDHMVKKQSRQIVALLILSILTLIITLPAYTSMKPISRFLDIADSPRIFTIINLFIILISILLNFSNIRRGLIGLFTLNANANSMMAIFSISSAIYTSILIYRTDLLANQLIHLYTLLVCVALLLNNISHQIEVLRIRSNFNIVSSQKEKTAVEIVNDPELENDFVKLLGDGNPQVVVPVKTNFLKRFFELSFDDYHGDSMDRILVPIGVALSVLLGLGSFFLLKDLGAAVTVFFSSLFISAPLTSLLCTNLPLYKASKRLNPIGSMLSGNEAVWEFSQTTALTIDVNQLFPRNSVILQGIKTFEGGRIDQAILDATSVLHEIKSPLSKTFLEIIENRTELLSKVDSIMYEDEMGVSAWVDDRRILVGNRELMINHGVEVPDKSYEIRYTEGGRDIVYLATSGVLTAMYVVKYMADTEIADTIYDLNENFVSLIVRTNDPNITALKMSEVFGLNLQNIRVIPERRSGPYERVTRTTSKVDAKVAYIDNIIGYFCAIIAAVKLAPTISTSFLIQTIGIVLGFIVISVAAIFSAIIQITPFTLIAYNLFWLLVIFLINATRRV